MHECPECGEYCGCDGEDHDQEAPDDCSHDCDPEPDDDDFDEPTEDRRTRCLRCGFLTSGLLDERGWCVTCRQVELEGE